PIWIGDVFHLLNDLIGRLQRRMHGIEGEVKKPRLFLVAVDESTRLLAQYIGEIALDLHAVAPAQHRSQIRIVGLQIGVLARQEAKRLGESSLERMEFRLLAEVPLTDQSRRVAGGLEPVGNRGLAERQPLSLAAGRPPMDGIELVAEALLV